MPKDDFIDKAYLVKVMTKGEEDQISQKIVDVFYERPPYGVIRVELKLRITMTPISFAHPQQWKRSAALYKAIIVLYS